MGTRDQENSMRLIATHLNVDLDAVVSAWLASDFLFPGQTVDVQFIRRGRLARRQNEIFDCVVDTGRIYDTERLRFDHRPPAFPKRTTTCAAKLVWEHLMHDGRDLACLEPLIELTHAGDSGRRNNAVKESRVRGPHAKLAALKREYETDREVFDCMTAWLDCHYVKQGPGLLAAYHRGKRSLDARRVNGGLEWPGLLTQGRPAQCKVTQVADELQVPPFTLVEDDILAYAVDTIVANCDAGAFEVLFDPDNLQTRKGILMISRKSAERQRHRIGGVASGAFRSVRPQSTDRVPDTMNFAKVLSRLARARGSIVASHRLISDLSGEVTESMRADFARTTEEILLALKEHRLCVNDLEVQNGDTGTCQSKTSSSESKLVLGQASRQLKSALALIEKNVRDIPASSYDLRPTSAELKRARREIKTISNNSKLILARVGNGCSGRRGRWIDD